MEFQKFYLKDIRENFVFSEMEAGQMGLSMVIANIIGAIAMSPVTSITTDFTMLVENGNIKHAYQLFYKAFLKAIGILVFANVCFVALLIAAQDTFVAPRLLSPWQLSALFASFSSFYAINALVIYFRAFRKEPLAIPTLVAAALQLVCALSLVKSYGLNCLLTILMSVYFCLNSYSYLVFTRFNNRMNIYDPI